MDATIEIKTTPAEFLEQPEIQAEEGGGLETVEQAGTTPPETPPTPTEPAQVAEPPAAEKKDPFRTRFGKTAEQLEQELSEANALRGRKFVEDDSKLLADEAEEALVKAWRAGGWQELDKFYEARRTDWGKLPDDDVVRDDVARKVGKDAPRFMFDKALRARLEELGFSEDLEVGTPAYEEHRKAVAWAAKNIRDARISEQQSYKFPEPTKPQQPDYAAEAERHRQEFMASQSVRSFVAEKAITIDGFRYEVEPQDVLDLFFDQPKLNNLFIRPDGTPDDEKLFRWYSLALDMNKPFELYAASKVAQAKQDWVKSQVNARETQPDTRPAKGQYSVEWAK